MATVQEPSKAQNRYERIVRDELSRAILRVRMLDLAQAGLGLVIAILVYALVMILADKWLVLPSLVRQIGLVGLGIFVVLYGWFILLRPIRRAINPYYAAVQVEQTIPDAKNSLVNWLDLHGDQLPPSIASAIGQRAAEDLKEADVQTAIRSNLLVWLCGITLGLVAAFLACIIIMRTDQFGSLLTRAFSPFSSQQIVKRTRIQLLSPEGGDATVLINRSVTVTVHVDGRIPEPGREDSLALLVRYNPEDPNYDRYELQQSEHSTAEWSFRLAPHHVRTGFYYKVVGGDDETPEFRVMTRSSPHIDRFEVRHTYRPYLRFSPQRTFDPNIEDYRGTEIVLDAFTNRHVREGKMLLESEGQTTVLRAEHVPERPEAMRFRFKLERDSKYRIWFTTTEDESNNDPLPYTIKVIRDIVPQVEFTSPEDLKKPEPDCELNIPADGMLRLEAIARDDFGIRSMTLRMKLEDRALKPKPYLSEEKFRLDTGGFMREVHYKDDVDFTKLVTAAGLPIKPETGMILEYWLEAEDNFDDPTPQVGSTRKFRVKIMPPKVKEQPPATEEEKEDRKNKQEERDNERKQAEQERKNHEQKHEQDRKEQSEEDRQAQKEREEKARQNEEKARQNEQQQPQDGNQQDQNQNNNDPKNADPKNPDQPNRGENNNPDPKNNGQQNPESGGQNEQSKNDGGNENLQDKIEKLKEELRKEQEKNNGQNQPQPDNGNKENKQDQPQQKPQGGMGEDNPQEKPGDPMNPGGGAASDSKKPNEQQPNNGEDRKGAAGNNPMGPNQDQQKPMDGGQGMNDAKTPNKPAGQDPMRKTGDGSDQNPDAKPNEQGNAKGNPQNQKPNPNQAGNPNDPNAKPPEQKPGEGGMGQDQKTDPKNGAAPQKPTDDNKGNAQDQGNKPMANDPGAGQPKPGDPNKGQQQPDKAPNNNGKPMGNQSAGKPGDQDAQPKPGPAKPSDNNPRGQGEQRKPEPGEKPMGTGDQDKPMDNCMGGDKGDIQKLAEQMEKGNAQQREDARKQLGEMVRNDPDPMKRQAAEEALKNADKNQKGEPGNPDKGEQPMGGDPMKGDKPRGDPQQDLRKEPGQPGNEKPNDQGDPMKSSGQAKKPDQVKPNDAAKPGEKKNPQTGTSDEECKNPGEAAGQGSKPQAGGKPGMADGGEKGQPKSNDASNPAKGQNNTGGMGNQTNPMGKPNDQSGKPMNDPKANNPTGDMPGDQQGPGKSKSDNSRPGPGDPNDDRPGEGRGNPGNGSEASRQQPGGNPPPEERKPSNPNEEFKNREGELNLEKIDKQKLKELFQKYNITEEEWKQYQAQQQKKMPGAKPDPKNLQAADRKGGSFTNTGTRRVEGAQDKDPSQLNYGRSGQAPPEYRKAAEKFAEMLAKPPERKK